MELGHFDYSIESVYVTSSTGEVNNIKDLVTGISVYESLNSPYIKVEMDVVDAANFLELSPIIGQEKVEISMIQNTVKIKKVFYIAGISNYIRANNQSSLYTIKLITPEQMMNSLVLVSQAYSGNISSAIKNIITTYLKSKINLIEETNGNYSVIIPNWNPFQAIDWLVRRAMDTKQTPFVFFETFVDGFQFKSYTSLLKQKVYNKFVHKGGNPGESDAEATKASYNVAIEYDLRDYSNTYKNNLRGAFGSGIHLVDIATKKYNLLKYDYLQDFKKKEHLDKQPFINDKFKVDGKSINEFDAVHQTVNKNTMSFGIINNYNNEAEFTVMESNAYVNQMTLIHMNLLVRGRLDLTPGKIIEFEVDRDKPSIYGNTKDINEYISGRYLVVNVHHKFSMGKYHVLMDCARDSFGKKIKKRG